MERKKALALAGTITLSTLMAGTAMAANLGLLGADDHKPGVGLLDAHNVAQLSDRSPVVTQPTSAGSPATETPGAPEVTEGQDAPETPETIKRANRTRATTTPSQSDDAPRAATSVEGSSESPTTEASPTTTKVATTSTRASDDVPEKRDLDD